MENTHEIQTALIHFIQSKPEGNALRDIAIRTLRDMNAKEVESEMVRTYQPTAIRMIKHNRKRVRVERILPMILYRNLKHCKSYV